MKNKLMFKVEKGKLYSAPKPKGFMEKIGDCPFCGEPVYASNGQLIVHRNGQPTHRRCRKENK